MPDYTLYNTETDEHEAEETLTSADARNRNAALRAADAPQRWVPTAGLPTWATLTVQHIMDDAPEEHGRLYHALRTALYAGTIPHGTLHQLARCIENAIARLEERGEHERAKEWNTLLERIEWLLELQPSAPIVIDLGDAHRRVVLTIRTDNLTGLCLTVRTRPALQVRVTEDQTEDQEVNTPCT